jgi:dTDP-4-amino-4,6-dideoxygalactose transaminase
LTAALSEDTRNKGLGRKIFLDLIEIAQKKVKKICLEVLNTNIRALNLYKSLGFVEVGEQDNIIFLENRCMIPLFKVRMSSHVKNVVGEVLESGYIGQGPKVEEFEDLLQKELNLSVRPVTVNSCTSAIDLALHLIGVGPEDEVISTPQTCFASQVGAIHRGAKIRWADIDPITGCIDPISVAKLVTSKTKTIIAVNWAGKICDFKSLKRHGIPVIEDAAHCWDVFNNNQSERGDYICYSFQAIKFLTCGDGGLLVTPKEKEHDARLLRWYGLDRTKNESFRCTQNIQVAGFKYHMNDISASIGIENISLAKESVQKHRENSKYLIENISNSKVKLPEWDENCSYWIFSIHILDDKNKFMNYLKAHFISSNPVHYRNDEYDCTLKFKEEKLFGVESFTQTQVCIPNGWWLSKNDLNYIVNVINKY